MSVEGVNQFTSTVLQQLLVSQNSTGNVAISGLSLMAIMGAVNLGLSGSSYDQLSTFLGEGVTEIDDTSNWKQTRTAEKMMDLDNLVTEFFDRHSSLFHSCEIKDHYEKITEVLVTLHKFVIDFSNPARAARKMNMWISEYLLGPRPSIFNESMLSDKMVVFIDSLFISIDWRNAFDESHTKQATFFDNQGQSLEVSMMSTQMMSRIYDSPKYNFRILFKAFKDGNRSAAIVLPRAGHKIEEVLKNFNFDEMHIYFKESKRTYVKLTMPKFKIRGPHDLVNAFRSFGVTDIFDPHRSNFGRMTTENVFLGTLIQVLEFDLRESGVNSEVCDDGDSDDEADDDNFSDGDEEDEVVVETSHSDSEEEEDEGKDYQSHSDTEDGTLEMRQEKYLHLEPVEGVDERSDEETEDDGERREDRPDSDEEDSEDPGDEMNSQPEEFLVDRPFLFLMYSSKADVVFYSAAVTNPNAK
ncbi:Serine proteinase inhibitor A3K [Thelohanellus kitauei]|uniref:Serine proteinase inhibitor A3K n=1 Tax=Thelohanellus kitauei TaxID=669202 RepID=A0A0C2JCI0_THEKT|nr:Serine proteinase inhibitor A3K [Thelohanellus kitauei]